MTFMILPIFSTNASVSAVYKDRFSNLQLKSVSAISQVITFLFIFNIKIFMKLKSQRSFILDELISLSIKLTPINSKKEFKSFSNPNIHIFSALIMKITQSAYDSSSVLVFSCLSEVESLFLENKEPSVIIQNIKEVSYM